MKLDQMRYFLEIARCSSINKAAENLHLSQQNLNSSLNSLEEELGHKLCIRSHAGIRLTEKGTAAKNKFEMILTEMDALQTILDDAEHQPSEQLCQLTCYSMLSIPSQPVIDAILQTKYKEQISINYFQSETAPSLFSDLLSGKEGLYLLTISPEISGIYKNLNKANFHIKPITSSGLFVSVGAHHPLANQKTVTFKSALRFPIAIFQYNNDSEPEIDKVLSAMQKDYVVACRTNDKSLIHALVKNSNIITFFFRYHQRRHLSSNGFVQIPVIDHKERTIAAICTQDYYEKNKILIDSIEVSLMNKLQSGSATF